MFSLESPHRDDSNEYTQYTIFNIKKKVTLNYSKSAAMALFQGTQERVRNSRGKRAISVPATEVLSYADNLAIYKFENCSSFFPYLSQFLSVKIGVLMIVELFSISVISCR